LRPGHGIVLLYAVAADKQSKSGLNGANCMRPRLRGPWSAALEEADEAAALDELDELG